MTTPADLVLTQIPVLDSIIAYRETGSPNSPTVLLARKTPSSAEAATMASPKPSEALPLPASASLSAKTASS